MTGTTAIDNITPFAVDGNVWPATDIDNNFSHRLAERAYAYIDAEGHDWTGRGSLKCTVNFCFYNTIKQNLYPGEFATALSILWVGNIVRISHPDVGEYDARVTDVHWTTEARRKHGVRMTVSFTESLADPEQPTEFKFATGAAADIAAAIDTGFGALGISYPNGMGDLADTIARLNALPAKIGAEVAAKWDAVVSDVHKLRKTLDASIEAANALARDDRDAVAGSVDRIVVDRLLSQMFAVAKASAAAASKTNKPTKTHVTTRDVSLPTLSFELQASLGTILDLNPKLIVLPVVPKGTTVLYAA